VPDVAALSQTSSVFDELLMNEEGGFLWCALSVKKLNAGTQMRRAIWILQDISPRKNAEEP